MSAFRRLTSSFRSERRCEQACPYSRPQPSPPKPKPTRRPRYWDFFNFFSFAAPYTDEEEEEAKKEAEAKAKASQQAEVIIVPEQDSEMSDASVSASSTEESTTTTSDSSLETVETAETSEHAEPVEPAIASRSTESEEPGKHPELAPSRLVEPANSMLSQTSSIPVSPRLLDQPSTSSCAPVSLSTVPMSAKSDDEFLEWAKKKRDSQTPFTYADVLGLKAFLEYRRKDLEYEPIKLRFVPRESSPPTASPKNDLVPDAASAQQLATETSVSPQASTDSDPSRPEAPSYWSAFHSSKGLPTFKNNVPAPRPRRMLKSPIVAAESTFSESRKRPAPLVAPRLDPYKRRRLFGEARGPVTTSDAVSSSQSSSTNVPGSVPLVTPRPPRTGLNRQHAIPHAPSPLRNVVNGSPPASPPSLAHLIPTNLSATGSRGTPTNQTASAAYLQEVVDKVMPRRPRYSDVVNPYQTAAPVKPVIKPMERKRMSERRERAKEVEKQKEEIKAKGAEKRELSAKEIIEATVPKGAKRSRPPPNLVKGRSGNHATQGVASKRMLEESEGESIPTKKRRTVTVEDVSEEDDVRGRSVPVRPNVIIESRSPSPEPVPAPSRPPAETMRAKGLSAKVPVQATPVAQPVVKEASAKASPTKESPIKAREQAVKTLQTPKVPSSKELSSRASTRGSSAKGPSNHFSPLLNSKVTGKSSAPREPSKLRTSFLPDECENEEPKMASPTPSATVTMTTPGTPLADIQEKKDPKEVALTLPLNDLPSFIFKTPPALMAGDHTDARVAAKELPVTSLPRFDFSKARTAINGVLFPAVPIPTIKPFEFEAVGVKPNATSSGQWQCPTCMLQNTASAVEKCSICEAPRPGVEKPKKIAMNGINRMNGAKIPAGVNGKISSPKSNSTSATSPAVKTFDFAAAGLAPNAPVADGQWTCSICMLQNPATAAEKCIVCDSPRFAAEKMEKTDNLAKPKNPNVNGTAHSSKKRMNGVAPATVKSFDFTAAGLAPKAPSVNSNWHCPTCMLQNPATALEKCKVCDSPRPGIEKRATQLPIVPLKSISQFMPKSFDWAGAGLVPKFNGRSWTCETCMLSNPPTETEKCKVCDASRS
ncbi:hypothetical protein ACEPAI_3914 [Sanghuangporus weigelae]